METRNKGRTNNSNDIPDDMHAMSSEAYETYSGADSSKRRRENRTQLYEVDENEETGSDGISEGSYMQDDEGQQMSGEEVSC
jgi:hypothetical protein